MREITQARRSGPAPEITQTTGRVRLPIKATKTPPPGTTCRDGLSLSPATQALERTIGWAAVTRRQGILRPIVDLANPEGRGQIPATHKWHVLLPGTRLHRDQRRRHNLRLAHRHSLPHARPPNRRAGLSPPTLEHSEEQAIRKVIAPRAIVDRPVWVASRGLLAVAGGGNNNAQENCQRR
jgi:hypothetical protein